MTVLVELNHEEHYLIFLALQMLEIAYQDIRQEAVVTSPSGDRPMRSTVDDVLAQIGGLRTRLVHGREPATCLQVNPAAI